jgi:hypothetical protein
MKIISRMCPFAVAVLFLVMGAAACGGSSGSSDGGIAGDTGGGGDGGVNAPSIPHQITSSDDSYCLGCHKTGAGGAPVMPHPDQKGCTNCHKPQ